MPAVGGHRATRLQWRLRLRTPLPHVADPCFSIGILARSTGRFPGYDFGFAVLDVGGNSGPPYLVENLGAQAVQFSSGRNRKTAWAFGYPAAGKYTGADLVYCKGPLGTDPLNNKQTYRLGCDMTPGSSGGPWFQGFDETAGTGTVMSLNSYVYSGITAMHGPKFNSDTQAVYTAALGATIDTTPADNNVIVTP
ncbi:MAG TPA: hypothetical protein ENH00_09170 [Actinobacteria bacterium]|nr:hypothetical protein [Actinomycetota bacterium]